MIDSPVFGVYTQESPSNLSVLQAQTVRRPPGPTGETRLSMPITLLTPTHGRSTTEPQSLISGTVGNRSGLSRLIAGEWELSAFAPGASPPGQLAPAEAAALARALGCPDLFLFDASERIVRERVVIQFIRRAAESGERLLVLSPDPAAADRIVETLGADHSLRIVRALADDENPVRPSPLVSRLTGAAAGANRAEQLKREAAQTVAAIEAKVERLERARVLHRKLDDIERERAALADQVAALEVEVRSKFVPVETGQPAVLQQRRAALQAELDRIRPGFLARLFGFGQTAARAQRLQELAAQIKQLDAECDSPPAEERIATEVAARGAPFAARQAELDAEAVQIEQAIRESLPPATLDDTVENGSPAHAAGLDLERELAVARTRRQELAEAGPDLPRRLLAETHIVVGTPGSMENDPVFSALAAPFDRLVLDHAEELTEEALDRLAPLAARWVLAGDAAAPIPTANGRPGRTRSIEPSLLCRLARRFDREPWSLEGDRLIIRRAHLAPAQRSALVREPLIDHPDVELGVFGDGEPVLAEISFPASTAIPAAKSFLFTQLGEVVLRPCGEPVWHRSEDRLTACWPMLETAGEWIDLEPGIRELVVGRGLAAFTAAVTFDAAIWDQPASEAWLAARTAPDASRVARLPCDSPAPRPAYAR